MAAAAVNDLADEYWAFFRSTEQLWNIDRGDVEQIEHWEDLSAGGVAARVIAWRTSLAEPPRSRARPPRTGSTLPEFHDTVLANGMMPLAELDRTVTA